jgi:DNA mismatch repair protein MutS2
MNSDESGKNELVKIDSNKSLQMGNMQNYIISNGFENKYNLNDNDFLLYSKDGTKSDSDKDAKQLQLKESHLKETQQAEQANLLAETLSKVDAAIKTLANPDLKLHEAIRLKQTLTELLKPTNQAEPNEAILDVAIGDYVEETNTRMRGKVINLSKQSLTMVTADGLTVKVKFTQVEKTTPPSASQPSKALRLVQSQKAPSSITIIGLRYEEAKQAVEKYYDLALMSSLKTIKIIHGFGSGTLRKMVYDYFQGLTTVKTIQQGEGDQAGYGVTIIHFK